EQRIMSKMARRLLPILVVMFLIAFIDRQNVGFAKLQMVHSLGMTEAAFGLASSLFFMPTLDSFREVFARSNYFAFAWNSVLISAGVTVISLLFAVPAAYAMAFFPNHRTQKVLLWMLSTKMMPSVGVLVPIYLLWKNAGLLDTVSGLVIVYTLINLPIAVWMTFTYFNEIPKD
ncbi:hypothetical protein M3640_20250, partial [Bacillus velezensis]|nr:hypothetical protein [Bacillus velezensis]